MSKSKDVVLVGGGLAGLSAAALLAQDGIGVTVIEQDQDVGGRLKSLEREGYRLDAGLHCFHYGEGGPLGELDRALELNLDYLESNDPGYILKGKTRLAVPTGPETKAEDVPGFSEDEAGRINEWYEKLMAAEPSAWDKKPVSEFIIECGLEGDELISSYAGALCLTMLGMGIDKVSAGALMSHSRAVGRPGFHVSAVAGGPVSLVKALADKVANDHSRIVLGCKVIEMAVADKKIERLVTSSEEMTPAAVIYTGPLQELPDLFTGEKPSAAFARTCKKLAPVSGIALELGLEKTICDLRGVMIDPEEAIIGRFPSNLDPSLAPEGAQISSWLALAPTEDLADAKTARSHIKRLKRAVQRQFPEIMDCVKIERLRVIPLIAGAAPTHKQGAEKRPKIVSRSFENLFLAGDAVSGPGILSGAAVSSAMEAARAVKELLSD